MTWAAPSMTTKTTRCSIVPRLLDRAGPGHGAASGGGRVLRALAHGKPGGWDSQKEAHVSPWNVLEHAGGAEPPGGAVPRRLVA